jgi:hypothetical protein
MTIHGIIYGSCVTAAAPAKLWQQMTSKKNNESAKDLWRQVFGNLAKGEYSALLDPEYDRSKDEAKMADGLKDAGWSDEHVRHSIERQRLELTIAPETSPGVNPFVETQLARLCDDVEAAMDRLSLDSHAKVARGVEPRAWAYASKVNVVMTDESIVTVSAFLFRFCGLIARAFTRTLLLEPDCWDSKKFDERLVRIHLTGTPELLRYWMNIYLSFAVTGTHVIVPYKPAKPHELLLFEQVARAMEIFVIAHEYGHLHHRHGKGLEADPHVEEFEADQFALRIAYEVERYPFIFGNPYLSSGAGGVILLMALKALREIEQVFGLPRDGVVDTHPAVSARIAKFDSVAVLNPHEFQGLRNFRTAAGRVMRIVHSILLPTFKSLPPDLLKDIAKLRSLRD